jgi:4-diphosphocytidyl-2-C-methyl-D-erythritol kinase
LMKSLFDIPAPAKLNLFLHIVGRRADGYHLLESVFMLIDWCDTLHFEVRADGAISREDLSTALPADDLIVRAARALQQLSGTSHGVHIGIAKSIPEQAGLGGGSSDAASTLLALNRLWGLRLSLPQLQAVGLQLGADVPFFLSGHNAWVSGVGERMKPVTLDAARFLVVKPRDGLQTQRIFSHPDLKRDSKTATISDFAADAFGFGHNDLQPVAQLLCPAVTQALLWCRERGLNARMTGSGSSVFARIAEDFEAGDNAGFRITPCRNLAVHPLQGWAG